MAIAGGNITLDSTEGMDKITQTEKVTSPYFSNGATVMADTAVESSSLSDTNEKYFFGISHTDTLTTEEFNVTFGSLNGFGANVEANTKSETEVIYKQFANMLLAPTEVTGGFKISSGGSDPAVATKDEEIYVMAATRTNMKDRINKGTWEVKFAGTTAAGLALGLHLIDDSSTTEATATPVGDRYNIVSGSQTSGVFTSSKHYGHFYPDMGMLVFSAAELSASIPGKDNATEVETIFGPTGSQDGFHYSKTTNLDSKPALRLIRCLSTGSALASQKPSLTFRDEEDQVSAQYFCRVRSGQMNFSNNPTFVSGSLNELRQATMKGNPNTFISSVQLYNDAGDMVAVGNLSTPLKKNFSSEATIKVKLTY